MAKGESTKPVRANDLDCTEMIPTWLARAPKLIVAGTVEPVTLPAGGMHFHSSYEFMLPLDQFTTRLVGSAGVAALPMAANLVFPFNSNQPHGPGDDAISVRFQAIMVDPTTLNDIAESLGAKAAVEFVNESRAVDGDVRILMHLFTEEAKARQTGSELILDSLSTQMIVRLLRGLESNMPGSVAPRPRIDRKGIAKAAEFLRSNYAREYSLDDLARVAEMSPYHFIRVFKAQTGKAPHEYLVDVKIDRACELLRQNECSITEICFGCGFTNPSHFATVFKRKIGVSPSQYRRMTSH